MPHLIDHSGGLLGRGAAQKYIVITFYWTDSLFVEEESVLDVTPPMPLLQPELAESPDFSEKSKNKLVKLSMKTGNRLLEKLSVKQKATNEKNKNLRSLEIHKKRRRILSDFELEVRNKRKTKCSKYRNTQNRNQVKIYKICSEQ